MSRDLPSNEAVQEAMQAVLDAAAANGRHPTLSAVQRRFNVPHPTFYRNYPDLIDWFREQAAERRAAAEQNDDAARRARLAKREDDLDRLRRENTDLRKTVKIYAESIRQLTVDNEALRTALEQHGGVADLGAHRAARRP